MLVDAGFHLPSLRAYVNQSPPLVSFVVVGWVGRAWQPATARKRTSHIIANGCG